MTNSVMIKELESQLLRIQAKKTGAEVAHRASPRFLPYKICCDMYHSLTNIVSAETSTALVASRFRGISAERGTVWPAFDPKKLLSVFAPDPSHGPDIYRGGITIQRSLRVPGIFHCKTRTACPPP